VRNDLVVAGALVAVSGRLNAFDERGRTLLSRHIAGARDAHRRKRLAVYAVGRSVRSGADCGRASMAESVAAASFTGQLVRGPVGRMRPIDQSSEAAISVDSIPLKASPLQNCAFPVDPLIERIRGRVGTRGRDSRAVRRMQPDGRGSSVRTRTDVRVVTHVPGRAMSCRARFSGRSTDGE